MKSIISLTHVQIGNVRIDLSSRNIAVAEQRLNGTRIGPMLHQVRAEAVTQRMRRDIRHPGRSRMSLDD